MRSLVASALALLAGGCLKADVNRCDNGAICKHDQACTERLKPAEPCGDPMDVAACFGMPNRMGCTHPDGSAGSCGENLCGACDVNWVECRYPDKWTAMTPPTTVTLHAVWAFAANDAVAVSDDKVFRYDGTVWTMASGFAPTTNYSFTSVWGDKTDSLFLTDTRGVVFHNGTPETSAPNAAFARSVWGSSDRDVVAVGQRQSIGERKDGSWGPWMQGGTLTPNYNAVWGTGNDVIAVGANLVQHRSSGTWSSIAPPSGDTLFGVWGTTATDFFVVGNDAATGRAGVIYHYTGSWMSQTVPASTPSLAAIVGLPSGDAFAVGLSGTILHYHAGMWTPMEVPDRTTDLQAIAVTGSDLLAVGTKGAIWKLSAN